MSLRAVRVSHWALSFVVLTLAASRVTRPISGAAALQPAPLQSGPADDVRRLEYDVSWQARTVVPGVAGAYHAANRSQNLRTYFARDAVHIVSRSATPSSWDVTLRLSAVGGGRALEPVGAAVMATGARRVEYRRPGLTEWYVNDEDGLEQGFTIPEPPERKGRAPLTLALALSGTAVPRLVEDGKAVEFTSPDGAAVLRYAGLKAWDARGVELSARMDVSSACGAPGCELRLTIDDARAVYPVVIDPLATNPAWTAEPDQAGASFGFAVGGAGDVNGDGHADVIVGAPDFDNGEDAEGRAYLYLGSASGLAAAPAWMTEGDEVGAALGASVGSAGDVNGDGYDDVVVGVPGAAGGMGRALVFHGSPVGLASVPAWSHDGQQAGGRLGQAVGSAGDVDGDGHGDVLVGAPFEADGQPSEGRAYVFLGSPSGLLAAPAWTREADTAGALLGSSLATAGDVNGDGYADVIVGAPGTTDGESNEGRALLFQGSASGLGLAASWSADGNQAGASLGAAVGTAGDVNGDGYADVIVGAPGHADGEAGEGQVLVFLGSASGVAAAPGWAAGGNQPGASLGTAVGTAGDVNGDGYADVVVGASHMDAGETDEGLAFLYEGSGGGLAALPSWSTEGAGAEAWLGAAVSAGGDVNGDGYADVLLGSPGFDGGESNEGRALAFLGSAAGPSATASWTGESNQGWAAFGYSVASAGDVNGDGYADVIVGAYAFDAGQNNEGRAFLFLGSPTGTSATPSWTAEGDQAGAYFGSSVATAGDVNGDGYSDVIVGAYNHDGGETNEGRAYVFLGSPAGPAASPAWTAESNQAGADFGRSVASAGDVNGDGYADVIVGSPLYSNGQTAEGRVFVYLGSPWGVSPAADWTAESNQGWVSLGRSVGTAGDVNGDGYADVIVGAPSYDHGQTEEGRVFVYLGSTNGLGATPAWSAEGDQAFAHFGWSAATAGDVNGDGYSDVIVGALDFDGDDSGEGRAYVFLGSATGPAPTPVWTADGDQAAAGFGVSVETAGDVNGDGYADVLVGASRFDGGQTEEGGAFLFLGSPAGPGTGPAWTAEGNQAGASLGVSVASAGDVNGDGYADVLVGAFNYDGGQTDEGAAHLFGGNGAGRPVLAGQLRVGLEAVNVQPWGRSHGPDAFQVRMTAVSPAGRDRVKVEVEACPAGAPFGAAACVAITSPTWTDVTASPAGTNLALTVPGLDAGAYRWRARTLHAPFGVVGAVPPPHPAHGPWRRLAGQSREADIRTGLPQALTITFALAESGVPESGASAPVAVHLTTSDGEPASRATRVSYATYDGSALAGSDYTAVSGVLAFPLGTPNGMTQTVAVPVLGDFVAEGTETFGVSLSAPWGAALGVASHTVTITDDDALGFLVTPSFGLVTTEAGGTDSFTVALASQPTADVDIGVTSTDTTEGTVAPSTLTFTPASWNVPQTVIVTGVDDPDVDGNVAYLAALAPAASGDPSYAGLDPGDVAVTNQDDEPAPAVSVGDVAVVEGNAGTTVADFTLTLSHATGQTVSVDFDTADGTATTADADYSPASGTVTFDPWVTVRTVTVPVTGDTTPERHEVFFLDLTNALGASIGDPRGFCRIGDDDDTDRIFTNGFDWSVPGPPPPGPEGRRRRTP